MLKELLSVQLEWRQDVCAHESIWVKKVTEDACVTNSLHTSLSQLSVAQSVAVSPRMPLEKALKRQWKVFLEGKLVPKDPPLTAEMCLQTTRDLAIQLIVYIDRSTTAGARNGDAGVIVTCGDPVDPAILHRRYLRGAAFARSSFAEEAAAMQFAMEWVIVNYLGNDNHLQLKAIECRSPMAHHEKSYHNARSG